MNLQPSVQLCVDLTAHVIADADARLLSTVAENFTILQDLKILNPLLAKRLTKSVGFRNIAIHSSQLIDWNIVFQICSHPLDDFRQFAEAVSRRIQSA